MRGSTLCVVVLVSAFLSTGCEPDDDSSGNTTTTSALESSAAEFMTWQESLAAGSALDLQAEYAQSSDLVVMWPVAVPGGDGTTSVTWNWEDEAPAQEALFTAFDSAVLDVTEERVIPTSNDSAVVVFHANLGLEAGGETTSMPVRGTLVYARKDGVWQIVHEHMSVDPAN